MSRCFLFCISLAVAFAQEASTQGGIVLQGGTVHTISGPVIEGGSVLVRNGKILAVGKNITPPAGFRVVDVQGQHVYPGMIDSGSLIGLAKPSDDQQSDAQEIGWINPQLRAATAMNRDSEQIPASRANGVTSVIEMPEGELLSGQMSLVRMDGAGFDGPAVAIHLRFPAIATRAVRQYESDDDDEVSGEPDRPLYSEAKREYDRKMTALNTFFEEARRYRHAKLAKSTTFRLDRKYEAILPVLDRTTPLFVTATREEEIRGAIAFAEKQKIRIILADAYECYNLIDVIKAHHIPVVLGPTLSLPLNKDDPYDRPFTTPADLYKAGIKFAIATFSAHSTRNLPYQAAAAVPFGLPADEAYKTVSLYPAEIFGLSKGLGSIEEGKTADLIVTDGDPLESQTHVNLVLIDGKPVSLETRQHQLYEKYLNRR